MQVNMYMNGEWQMPAKDRLASLINPADGTSIGTTAMATARDAKNAIGAANNAYDEWSALPPSERADYLYQIAHQLEKRKEEISKWETRNNGKPLRETSADVETASECFRYYAGLISSTDGYTFTSGTEIQGLVTYEPIGVCGLIIPWNHPILITAWKIAPALAAGNTIVLKPSEYTPISAYMLYEIFDQVGLPKGVANLVPGGGDEVGATMTNSTAIDKVSFTGGTETGKKIMAAAANNITNVTLELGGKSPVIVFADADIEHAVDHALYAIYFGSGQVCSAGSRILVEESAYEKFVDHFVARAKQIRVGPGEHEQTEMGPLYTESHMNNVLADIKRGEEEGATLRCGGNRMHGEGLDHGFFVAPTVFTDVNEDMSIVQEEIFGPVVVIQKFTHEKEAVSLANKTKYGLAAAVFTGDSAKGMRVIRGVKAGLTGINTYGMGDVKAPWGGPKMSGIGRSLGPDGLKEFQEAKQINVALYNEKLGWFAN
ncbi:aldehyde dehydrogenase family protein [Salicibibacter cibi]|nr:aldehyde dehydrogenase family protein [Salicibibacter cibi]